MGQGGLNVGLGATRRRKRKRGIRKGQEEDGHEGQRKDRKEDAAEICLVQLLTVLVEIRAVPSPRAGFVSAFH